MKKIALFGCGGFAKNHIKELAKRDEVAVSYLIDPSAYKIKELSDLYEKEKNVAPEGFNSLEEFLSANPEFDAAVIVTPPKTHKEIASEILKLRKPVYIEKPFTVSLEEAKELCRLGREKKAEIEIGANRCVFPAYRAAAKAFRDGKIGELKNITMYYRHNWEGNTKGNWRQDSTEPAAGLLADHSPHYSHFLFSDLKFEPDKIRHLGTRFNEAGVDVDTAYNLTDREGRNVYVVMDGSPGDDDREEVIKIYGSEGIIKIKFEGKTSNAYIEKDGKEKKIEIDEVLKEIESLGIKEYKSHPALIHNFISLISGKVRENANPGKEGILPVYLTELVEKSRGGLKEDSLTKEELKELAGIVKETGLLNPEIMEKYFNRGTEIKIDRTIINLDRVNIETQKEFKNFK
jgi:predicted dehydrogenase